ncbi:MAG: hypothetical protein KA149_04005 [Chitinophagales bacterium]|nr:hypothetical protein [Chitinophagales bacterium]
MYLWHEQSQLKVVGFFQSKLCFTAIRIAVLCALILTACAANAQYSLPIKKPTFISDTLPSVISHGKPFHEKELIGIWYEANGTLGDNIYHVFCKDTLNVLLYKIFEQRKKKIEQVQVNTLRYIPEKNQYQYRDYIDSSLTGYLTLSDDSFFLMGTTRKFTSRRMEYMGHAVDELWRGNKYSQITLLNAWDFSEFSVYIYTINALYFMRYYEKNSFGARTYVRYYKEDERLARKETKEGIEWYTDSNEYVEETGNKNLVRHAGATYVGSPQEIKK